MRDENEKSLKKKLIIISILVIVWLDASKCFDGLYNQIHFHSQITICWNVRAYLSSVPTTANQPAHSYHIQSEANEMFSAF